MHQPPRIISGVARGRRLAVPPGSIVRPTKDRVKAAIFSALEARGLLTDAVVLDGYAGSGALGLEALSRGAARATFIDNDRRAVAALRHNVAALDAAATSRVVTGDVVAMLAASSETFDLSFVDPPYDTDLDDLVRVVAAVARCTPGGTIVLEGPARGAAAESAICPANWTFMWERRFGDTLIRFAQPEIDPTTDP